MKRALYLFAALLALAPARAEPRNPLEKLRLEDLSATRDRPLFAPSRRPPPPLRVEAPLSPPPPAEKAIAAWEPPPFELVGSVLGKDTAIALLRNKATNQIVRVRLGEDAEGWRLDAIHPRSVSLVRAGRMQALALAGPPIPPAGAELAGEPQPAGAAVATPAETRHVGPFGVER